MWQHRHQGRISRHIPTLLQGLINTAPDHILNRFHWQRRVSLAQRVDQVGRKSLGPNLAKSAGFGARHGGANPVYYYRICGT